MERGDLGKFGPPPEPATLDVLLLHALACIVILLVLRPPFVMNETRVRVPLVLLIAGGLTLYILPRSPPRDWIGRTVLLYAGTTAS